MRQSARDVWCLKGNILNTPTRELRSLAQVTTVEMDAPLVQTAVEVFFDPIRFSTDSLPQPASLDFFIFDTFLHLAFLGCFYALFVFDIWLLRCFRELQPAARFSLSTSQPLSSLAFSRWWPIVTSHDHLWKPHIMGHICHIYDIYDIYLIYMSYQAAVIAFGLSGGLSSTSRFVQGRSSQVISMVTVMMNMWM